MPHFILYGLAVGILQRNVWIVFVFVDPHNKAYNMSHMCCETAVIGQYLYLASIFDPGCSLTFALTNIVTDRRPFCCWRSLTCCWSGCRRTIFELTFCRWHSLCSSQTAYRDRCGIFWLVYLFFCFDFIHSWVQTYCNNAVKEMNKNSNYGCCYQLQRMRVAVNELN